MEHTTVVERTEQDRITIEMTRTSITEVMTGESLIILRGRTKGSEGSGTISEKTQASKLQETTHLFFWT